MGKLLNKLKPECPMCGLRDFHLRLIGRYPDAEKKSDSIYMWECLYCEHIWKQRRIVRGGKRSEIFATGVTNVLKDKERSKLIEHLESKRRELEEHHSIKNGLLSHIPTAADDIINTEDADSDLRSTLDRLRDHRERLKDTEVAH